MYVCSSHPLASHLYGAEIETKVLATLLEWPVLLSLSLLITPEFLQAYPD